MTLLEWMEFAFAWSVFFGVLLLFLAVFVGLAEPAKMTGGFGREEKGQGKQA